MINLQLEVHVWCLQSLVNPLDWPGPSVISILPKEQRCLNGCNYPILHLQSDALQAIPDLIEMVLTSLVLGFRGPETKEDMARSSRSHAVYL